MLLRISVVIMRQEESAPICMSPVIRPTSSPVIIETAEEIEGRRGGGAGNENAYLVDP